MCICIKICLPLYEGGLFFTSVYLMWGKWKDNTPILGNSVVPWKRIDFKYKSHLWVFDYRYTTWLKWGKNSLNHSWFLAFLWEIVLGTVKVTWCVQSHFRIKASIFKIFRLLACQVIRNIVGKRLLLEDCFFQFCF